MTLKLNEELYCDRFDKHYFDCWHDRIQKVNLLIGDIEGKLLDVGCGDGYITELITKNKKLESYGVDIVDSNIEKARKRGIAVKKCDLQNEDLPFEDNSFELVFAGEILEHLSVPENMINEIHRVLKKDGIFIATVPNIASWYNRVLLAFGFVPYWIESGTKKAYGTPYGVVSGHLKAFTQGSLKEMFEDQGFTIIEIKSAAVDPRGAAEGSVQKVGSAIFYMFDRVFSLKSSFGTDLMFKSKK